MSMAEAFSKQKAATDQTRPVYSLASDKLGNVVASVADDGGLVVCRTLKLVEVKDFLAWLTKVYT